ncbi:cysteine-rich secretory protein 3-like [Argopecten irradians]|uniref:cysteine-rich secretory protein 3-like n=1 Tax=Argopecten irradians TaxID=31199 RepID=UPI00371D92EA
MRDKQREVSNTADINTASGSNTKRAQDLEFRLREIVKNILQERDDNAPATRADKNSANQNSQMQPKTQRRRGKARRKQKQIASRAVGSLEEAENLDMRGEETASKCTPEEKTRTEAAHQLCRELEPGSNTWRIHWDESLGRLAQSLSDTCVFKHTNLYFANGTRVGQNLAVIKGNNHTIEKVVQLFYNEKQYYDIGDHSFVNFELVGHYLQLEYWQTVKVGCGVTFCPTLYLPDSGEVWDNAYYWACDYWPHLKSGGLPFETGEPCSQCVVPHGKDIGWRCVEEACEECYGIGKNGCQPPGPCPRFEPDRSANICKKVKDHNFCNKGTPGYKYAKMYCKTTCEFCSSIPESLFDE